MTEHLPECCFAPHVCDVNLCQRCHAFCICNQLRACEERVLRRGLDAAREAVAALLPSEFWEGIEGRPPQWWIVKAEAIAAIDALKEGS